VTTNIDLRNLNADDGKTPSQHFMEFKKQFFSYILQVVADVYQVIKTTFPDSKLGICGSE